MNDIMKMIRFDLISVSRLTVPYVAVFGIVSIIAALFSLPIGILCVVSIVMIIAPCRVSTIQAARSSTVCCLCAGAL